MLWSGQETGAERHYDLYSYLLIISENEKITARKVEGGEETISTKEMGKPKQVDRKGSASSKRKRGSSSKDMEV